MQTAAALVFGLMLLYAVASLVDAPAYQYPQPFADWCELRAKRLGRALMFWCVGFVGLAVLALRACL